jgi:hypothetical protein
MTAHKSFFTAILATPLISLCLGIDFNLGAQSLIDALKGPTRSEEFKELQLDNVEAEEEYEGYGGRRLPDCLTATCTIEHIDELKRMSRSRGYTISGTTLYAQELWWEVVVERERAFREEEEMTRNDQR